MLMALRTSLIMNYLLRLKLTFTAWGGLRVGAHLDRHFSFVIMQRGLCCERLKKSHVKHCLLSIAVHRTLVKTKTLARLFAEKASLWCAREMRRRADAEMALDQR
jgi:hypothetical protein